MFEFVRTFRTSSVSKVVNLSQTHHLRTEEDPAGEDCVFNFNLPSQ